MSRRNSNANSQQSSATDHFENFKDILKGVGVILTEDSEPNVLTKEQALVVRDLENTFDKNAEANKIKNFIAGLKILSTDEEQFRKALLQTHLKKNDNNDTMNGGRIHGNQESVFRLLLKVNCLQKEVLDIILEEITKDVTDEKEDTSWLHLLLNALRYLPHITDPSYLSTKLLDILEVASLPSQLEILDSVPDIIPDSQNHDIAEQLSKLLDESDDLSGAIIDCLNALNLESDVRIHVQEQILSKMLAGTSLKIFPVLLEFLMTDFKAQNVIQIFFKIRNALDTIMMSSDKERESNKILIFNRLQTFARTSRTVSDGWVNMIVAVKVHSDHKPIDFLILFMLHSTAKMKKKIIEGLIKKRIVSGLFKISLLEKVFEKYIPQQLMKYYFSSILEIGCNLLYSCQDHTVAEFATSLFKIIFNHEYTEVIYRKELLDSLILLTGTSNSHTVGVVLKIISYFLDDFCKLQQHTVLLMHLLEKLDKFELKDTKQVFEILCALTCSEKAEESMSGLKDEIHIIVRKQLSSSKRSIKHRGIISAVVMAKHIAITSVDQSELSIADTSIITLANLPAGNARDAASILELTSTSCSSCPELMGLYYDQLASVLMTSHFLNKYFMAWLYETITDNFQNIYVTETLPNNVNDLEFSMQYLLNTEEEIEVPLGVNVGGLTIGPQRSDVNSIVLLAPHFRLLRLLHFRQQNGDLSTIDALLGCAIILPKFDDVSDLDSDQVKQVADCLFHCANWFREIISGFVTQKSKKLRAKVVDRLKDLIEVEKLLNNCMEYIPEYKLPVSYFDSLSQVTKQNSPEVKIKNPKKKFKSNPVVHNDNADDTLASTSTAQVPQTPKTRNVSKKEGTNHNITFREVDTDLIILLQYPLEQDENTQSTQTAKLNIAQLKFILKDFVVKLSVLTKGKNTGLSHLNVVDPLSIITDCIVILPNIDMHLKFIIEEIKVLLKETDGRHDLPLLYSEEAKELKICFGLILESLHLIFSWSGFEHSKNLDLLRNILKSLRPQQSQSLNSANRLIIELIQRLASYKDQCLYLSHAVFLIKIMEALQSVTAESPDIHRKVVSTSSKLLSKRWYNTNGALDSGKNCNANIDVLVKVYLKGADTKTICGLVGTLQDQVSLLKSKEDCLHMLASIDKQNFHVFYLGLCNTLLNRVKIELQHLTNNEHLVLWKTTALTLQGLMSIAKIHETKTNLSSFLKKSIAILKIFLSHGIPIMEIMLRSKPDEVVSIFKTIQTSTRFLHHLCCYSKLSKDTGLMSYVPQFRLTLETLVYRVKAALVANNCSAAFWMGNLRNRDLHGEDILSQSTVVTEQEENNEEQELPSDDEEVVNDSDESIENKSESEVYD